MSRHIIRDHFAYEIEFNYWRKPIPTSNFDWCATLKGYDEGDPMGHGATKAEAAYDLFMQIEDGEENDEERYLTETGQL